MKLITVVARYNEDLKWVESLNTDVVIYNKGDSFDFEMPRTDVPNIGRESETYCRFILDWYDRLHEYDAVVFLQGDPEGHINEPLEIINSYKKFEICYLSSSISFFHITLDKILNNINIFELFRILKKECIFNTRLYEDHAEWLTEETERQYLERILELISLLKIDVPEKVGWAPGAQFIVPVEYILNKSIKWWEDLFVLHYIYDQDEERSLPHIIERLWPVIWMHKT